MRHASFLSSKPCLEALKPQGTQAVLAELCFANCFRSGVSGSWGLSGNRLLTGLFRARAKVQDWLEFRTLRVEESIYLPGGELQLLTGMPLQGSRCFEFVVRASSATAFWWTAIRT